MTKYVIKRILLMFMTLFVITTICFMLIRILPRELPQDKNLQAVITARWDALGYNEPLLVQLGIYFKTLLQSGISAPPGMWISALRHGMFCWTVFFPLFL